MTTTIQNKIKEYAAGLVLAADMDEEILSQYEQLLKVYRTNPTDLALYHAEIADIYKNMTVAEAVELIEAEIESLSKFFETINPLSNLDWPYLRKQKELLISLQSRDCVTDEESDMIEGLLHLFDNFQDYAVDLMDKTEKEVFNF